MTVLGTGSGFGPAREEPGKHELGIGNGGAIAAASHVSKAKAPSDR
jgi:hypothetical protein